MLSENFPGSDQILGRVENIVAEIGEPTLDKYDKLVEQFKAVFSDLKFLEPEWDTFWKTPGGVDIIRNRGISLHLRNTLKSGLESNFVYIFVLYITVIGLLKYVEDTEMVFNNEIGFQVYGLVEVLELLYEASSPVLKQLIIEQITGHFPEVRFTGEVEDYGVIRYPVRTSPAGSSLVFSTIYDSFARVVRDVTLQQAVPIELGGLGGLINWNHQNLASVEDVAVKGLPLDRINSLEFIADRVVAALPEKTDAGWAQFVESPIGRNLVTLGNGDEHSIADELISRPFLSFVYYVVAIWALTRFNNQRDWGYYASIVRAINFINQNAGEGMREFIKLQLFHCFPEISFDPINKSYSERLLDIYIRQISLDSQAVGDYGVQLATEIGDISPFTLNAVFATSKLFFEVNNASGKEDGLPDIADTVEKMVQGFSKVMLPDGSTIPIFPIVEELLSMSGSVPAFNSKFFKLFKTPYDEAYYYALIKWLVSNFSFDNERKDRLCWVYQQIYERSKGAVKEYMRKDLQNWLLTGGLTTVKLKLFTDIVCKDLEDSDSKLGLPDLLFNKILAMNDLRDLLELKHELNKAVMGLGLEYWQKKIESFFNSLRSKSGQFEVDKGSQLRNILVLSLSLNDGALTLAICRKLVTLVDEDEAFGFVTSNIIELFENLLSLLVRGVGEYYLEYSISNFIDKLFELLKQMPEAEQSKSTNLVHSILAFLSKSLQVSADKEDAAYIYKDLLTHMIDLVAVDPEKFQGLLSEFISLLNGRRIGVIIGRSSFLQLYKSDNPKAKIYIQDLLKAAVDKGIDTTETLIGTLNAHFGYYQVPDSRFVLPLLLLIFPGKYRHLYFNLMEYRVEYSKEPIEHYLPTQKSILDWTIDQMSKMGSSANSAVLNLIEDLEKIPGATEYIENIKKSVIYYRAAK